VHSLFIKGVGFILHTPFTTYKFAPSANLHPTFCSSYF